MLDKKNFILFFFGLREKREFTCNNRDPFFCLDSWCRCCPCGSKMSL